MKEIFRNMWRRKFRTFLTIFGIVIGMFAFTVMGSMALKFNKMIDGGKKYMTGQITIVPKGSSFTSGSANAFLPLDTLEKIKTIEGVEAVSPMVQLLLEDDDGSGGFAMSQPATIYGSDFNSGLKNKNWTTLPVKEGRMLEAGDSEDKIAVGYNVALDKKIKNGEKFTIRGKEFNVIGIIDKTMTGPDDYVFMSIKPAREMLIDTNPFLKSLQNQSNEASKISAKALEAMPEDTRKQIEQAKTFKIEDITTMAAVTWKENVDSEAVANKIEDQFKDSIVVLSPVQMGEEIDKASAIFNAIILGTALIALIVGGFSIINTMIMSISERTKEIGIKKALGASGWSIAWEYTMEAGIIGLLGGAGGMGLGVLVARTINSKMAQKGAEIFLIDPTYLIGVIIFSFALGIAAGFFPAIRASRLRAVNAIREL